MEFNGAVLVSNRKIENALSNYTSLKREYEKEIKRCEDKLASQIGDLSWWDNFMCKDGDDDWFKVYKRKYKGWVSTYHKAWLYHFKEIGLVTESFHSKYEDIDLNHYYYEKEVYTLRVLSRGGEPVYLNPAQASFVNGFFVG